MKMRYLTRLNMLGSLAFISILIALSLLYTSGNFHTVGNKLSLKGTGSTTSEVAEENQVNDVPASPIPTDVDHRLVVFGDAWSAIGSRLAEQGQAWPEWLCSMVCKHTSLLYVKIVEIKAHIASGHVDWKHMRRGNMSAKALSADPLSTKPNSTPSFLMPPGPWSHFQTFAARLTNGLLQS